MSAVLPVLKRTAAVTLGSAVAGIGYASIIERNAFVVREVTMPVLSPGSSPLRVLHLSDLHMRPNQRHKQAWLRELACWEPDLVIDTGDGVPVHLAATLFDPFVSTKPVGSGMGMGLSISYNIIRDFGGILRVLERDGGAHFVAELRNAS